MKSSQRDPLIEAAVAHVNDLLNAASNVVNCHWSYNFAHRPNEEQMSRMLVPVASLLREAILDPKIMENLMINTEVERALVEERKKVAAEKSTTKSKKNRKAT